MLKRGIAPNAAVPARNVLLDVLVMLILSTFMKVT
jgi:hypothetical protein